MTIARNNRKVSAEIRQSAAVVVEQLEGRKLLASAPLYAEPFDEPTGATTGLLNGPAADGEQWRTYQPNGGLAVNAEKLRVENTGGFTSWFTNPLDIAGAGPVDLSLDLVGTNIGPDDLARFVYSVDGGPQQQFAFTKGQSGSLTATATGITGSTLKVEVQFQARQGTFTLDNFAVTTATSTGDEPVYVEGDTLFVRGTDAADTVVEDLEAPGLNLQRYITLNGTKYGPFDPNLKVDIATFGGNDTITTSYGTDYVIDAGAGDDSVEADADFLDDTDRGNTVVVNGGDGNDTLDVDVFDGAATLDGGAGNDQIRTSAPSSFGAVVVRGGDGNDTIGVFSAGTDATVDGGAGDDIITADNETNVSIRGGDGNDNIDATNSVGDVDGGAGNDTIVPTRSGTARGGAGNDLFKTTSNTNGGQSAVMFGEDGDDTLISSGSPDDFSGGTGTDTVDYRGRLDGPFAVSFDNVANDGNEFERDNIRDDVEIALGATVVGQPSTTLFAEPFDEANGANSGNLTGGGQWRTFGGFGDGGVQADRIKVVDGKLRVTNTNGFVSWFTTPLNIAGQGPVDISIDLTGTNLGPNDLARFIYSVDGGPQQQFAFTRGTNGTLTATATGITGSSLKVEVQFQALQGQYTLDNFAVKTQGAAEQVTVELVDGVIRITGTSGDDSIGVIRTLPSGGGQTEIEVDREVVARFDGRETPVVANLGDGDDIFYALDPGSVDRFVTVNGGAGDDTITSGGTINAGEGNDTVTTEFGRVDLGPGNDYVTSESGGSTVLGGVGDDTLNSGSGADDFSGGAGNDTVEYIGRDGEVTVTFDNVANDGEAGEGDNIRSDVENALGANTDTGATAPVYFLNFGSPDGATSGSFVGGGGTWKTFRGGLGSGTFEVIEDPVGVLFAEGTSGFVSFYTSQLDISTLDSVGVSIEVDANNFGPDDLVRAIYFVDGGPAQQFGFIRGSSGNGRTTFTADGITGDRIKVEIQLQAKQGSVRLDDFEINTPEDSTPPTGAPLTRETFDEPTGATSGSFDGVGTWRTFRGGANFSVQNGLFRATQTDGFRTWYTNRFDISGGPVDVSVDLASTGVLGDFDRLNVLVRVDGGPAQSLAQLSNRFDDYTATLEGLSGSTLQIEIQAKVDLDNGTYAWDNMQVTRA